MGLLKKPTRKWPAAPAREKALKAELRELRDAANNFYRSVEYPNRNLLWTYPLDGEAYTMEYLHQRVIAANALGYNVILTPSADSNNKSQLKVFYVKKPIPRPWQFDY